MPTDICRWLFLLISLSTWITYTYSKDVRVVCYYTNWSVYRPGQAKFSPQNINPYLCTHLIYAFGGFTKENTLKPFDKYQDIEKGGYAKFTGLKTYNKNLKTMLAIGGWNEGSSRFSPMVASAERRKELVKNAVKFLRQNHFDGLDLDWEYPTFRDGGKARDRENYAHLVKELREEFERESEKTGRPRLLLTMAVPAGIEYINKGYDVPKLSKYLDWMNILSYDYHSAFEPAVNHHAPLYGLEEDSEYNYDADLNIDHTIKHYLELGADPNKLVLGIPTYGRSYTLFNPDAYEIGAPADGPGDMGEATRENGYLAYYEICDYVKSQDWEVVQPNEDAMGPYAFKGNQWVGYDDEEISRKKAQYVAKNNLGGIMFWAIDNDDFRGNCHGKPYPLIEAAKEALLEAYGITDDNLIAPTSKPVKQKTRTRTKVSSKDESDNQVSTSTTGRRRTRVKPKTSESSRDASTSKSKPRRRNKTEGTSTYSSLKVVTPSYTTPAPPATPEMGGAFKCEDEGFFPHPKDCKKYFWCLSGAGDSGIIAHQFTCPAGLYFNKAADSCDYTQNVLCNKKLSRTTPSDTKTSTSSSTTEKPTVSSLFSSTRVPPKITAATSKTTYSVRTTEATPEEEEYEEYEEDEEEDRKGDSEEDPRVIKELIDLIKKAGGIEELEKRLRSGETSSSGVDSTTPSILSKSLVARVLGQTGKNKITKANTFPFISKNSRGSQTEGIEKTDTVKKVDRGRPQYTSIARTRTSSAEKDEAEEKIDTETENKDNTKSNRNFKKTNTVEYVNIRRPKVSTTTESSDDDEFNRNKILGENDSDDEEDGEIKKTTPQYVNIRRQRPSTTPETATSKYKEIRRGSASNQVTEINEDEETSSKYNTIRRGTTPSSVDDDEDEGSVTSKYRSIRRGTTSASTTESAVQGDNTSTKYKTIQRGSTTAASSLADRSSPKYSSISRGTTSPSSSTTTDDERTRGTTRSSSTPESDNDLKYKTIQRGSTTSINNVDEPSTTRILSTATESTLSSIKSTLNSIRSESVGTTDAIIYTTFSNGDLDITTIPVNTEIPGVISTKLLPVTETSASTRRTPPTLLEPRPFSIRGQTKTRVESTTPTTKIERTQPSRPFRVGGRRKTTTRPFTTTQIPTQRSTKPARRKYLPQTTKALESQDFTTSTVRTVNSRFRFISRRPSVKKISIDSKKNLILSDDPDQTIESSNQQSLEEDGDGGKTSELGDIAIALHDIQQAPFPSTTTRKPPKLAVRYTTTSIKILPSTTPRTISRPPTRSKVRFTTLTPIVYTTPKYVLRKKRPQAFDKIIPSDTNTFRPLSEYDYYDDEMSILGQIPEHSKVLLHSNGVIECLDQGNFPHPVSCKKFISCAKMENGKVLGWEYTCPKNLSFDPIGGICNWSAGLGCHEQ